tara:strand:+ start:1558 stop:2766 length:1209 start_codon:yes stop_codon:yes gene_type:complete
LKKILVVGPLLSISGYGYHSRQIFDYFFNQSNTKVSSAILPWGNTSWFVNDTAENGLIGNIIDTAVDIKSISHNEYDLAIHVQLPNEWNTAFAKKNIGISAYVETDICSKNWIDKTLSMDLVVVPSSFTKEVILNSSSNISQRKLLDKKISIVAEYYHVDFDKEEKSECLNLNNLLSGVNTEFNYLTVGQLTSESETCDRKNLIETLRYFCDHFKNNEDVGLILKTSIGRSTTHDKDKTKDIFSNIIKQVKGDSEYPKVYIMHGDLSIDELYTLYSHDKVNCYLTLTKGEGYGLPLLESGRCGLPVIATNWSGHLDFLDNDFLKVDYDLTAIPNEKIDNNIFVKNSKWAKVKKDSVIKQLKYSYKNYSEIKEKSKDLSKKIIEKFCKKEVIKKYDKIFKEYI